MSIERLAPAYIRAVSPYQAGKPIDELAREFGLDAQQIIKLASNENPLGTSPLAKQAVALALTETARYPDGNSFVLRHAIANKFKVSAHSVVLGNGSNDILALLAQAFLNRDTTAIYSQHSFAIYALITQISGAQAIETPALDFAHDLHAMRQAILPSTRIIFIANPNNPTGTWLSSTALLAFLKDVPREVLVVLDEAYDEYLPPHQQSQAISWLKEFENLIITRTFSKIYGLAGLRVGFGLMADSLANILQAIRQPFNVNHIAQMAALAALDDDEFVARSYAENQAGLQQLMAGFTDLGLSFLIPHGNFLCVSVYQAQAIYQRLLQHGIIVRPIANYGMPDYLRISVGSIAENERLLNTLKVVLAK